MDSRECQWSICICFYNTFSHLLGALGLQWRLVLIIAHNHPSGVAEPSRADRALTRRLREAVELVDVRLLDHIVVGDGEIVSFAERGWL